MALQISVTTSVRNHFSFRWVWIVALSLFVHLPFVWSEEAGYLARVFGEVRIDQQGANTGDKVISGSVISIGKRGFAVLKFNDGQILALRAESVLVVDEYAYRKDDSTQSRSHISLLRGGLRALTGLVGDQNKEAVSFDTPVATLGIRGTEFIMVVAVAHSDTTMRSPAESIELVVKVEQDEVVIRHPTRGPQFSDRVRGADLTDQYLLRLVRVIRQTPREELTETVLATGQVAAVVNGQFTRDLKKATEIDPDKVFEGLDQDLSQWTTGEAGAVEQVPFAAVEEIAPLQTTPGLGPGSGGSEATERPASPF